MSDTFSTMLPAQSQVLSIYARVVQSRVATRHLLQFPFVVKKYWVFFENE